MATTQSLKNELFSNLKNQGFHEEIKKQLRMKLIEQLKQKKLIETKTEKKMLFKRVLSSLVMQELQLNQSPFTESIYFIESGFEGSFLTRSQLIEMLTFKTAEIHENQSILEYIIRKKQPFASTTLQNIQIQTNPEQIGYTLQQRLMLVDQQYRMNLAQKENSYKSSIYDRKKFQHDLSERTKRQIELFKQFQAHKIKIKVGQQWRKKFQLYSQSIAQQYRRKYDQVRKKDKMLNEQFIFKNNQHNIKSGEAQKAIKQKIELIDMKNMTIETQMDNINRGKKDFQQTMTKKEKQLSEKIRQYDSLTLTINQKIKFQVNLAKLSIQQEYQQKQAETLRRKKIIDEDYGKLMGIKDSINIIEKQNVRLSNENNNLRTHLTSIEVQLKNTVFQLVNKVNRIQVLKDDLVQSEEKVREIQRKIQQEGNKSKRYENQIISMQRQLQQFRTNQNIPQNISRIESEPSVELQKNKQKGKIDEINKRIEKLKNQRKKDIEKFKLQL